MAITMNVLMCTGMQRLLIVIFSLLSFGVLAYFVLTEKEPYSEFETMWSA